MASTLTGVPLNAALPQSAQDVRDAVANFLTSQAGLSDEQASAVIGELGVDRIVGGHLNLSLAQDRLAAALGTDLGGQVWDLLQQRTNFLDNGFRDQSSFTDSLHIKPAGEGVVLEIVRDKPWWASCDYLGDLRSRIAVNVTLPMSAIELLILTLHETYPGHHVERSCKEHLLVRGEGMLEESLVLGPTPQSLVSEGLLH